jgi:ribosome-binding factor A
MTQRTERIDELLRQEISEILSREVADPRVGFVTVTEVETAPDLRHAKVWVSVIGEQAERDATIAALNRVMVFVRRELGTRLRIRRIPEFHVRLDDTAERGTRVLHLLQELEEGRVTEDPAPVGESLPTPVARLPRPGDTPPSPDEVVIPEAQAAKGRRGRPSPEARRRGQMPGNGRRRPGPRRGG